MTDLKIMVQMEACENNGAKVELTCCRLAPSTSWGEYGTMLCFISSL